MKFENMTNSELVNAFDTLFDKLSCARNGEEYDYWLEQLSILKNLILSKIGE
jgi:hypothetical protein